jgi:hypothetical protein
MFQEGEGTNTSTFCYSICIRWSLYGRLTLTMTVALWSGTDFVGRRLQYPANGATGFGVEPKNACIQYEIAVMLLSVLPLVRSDELLSNDG